MSLLVLFSSSKFPRNSADIHPFHNGEYERVLRCSWDYLFLLVTSPFDWRTPSRFWYILSLLLLYLSSASSSWCCLLALSQSGFTQGFTYVERKNVRSPSASMEDHRLLIDTKHNIRPSKYFPTFLYRSTGETAISSCNEVDGSTYFCPSGFVSPNATQFPVFFFSIATIAQWIYRAI